MALGDSVSVSGIKTETGLSGINNVSLLNTDTSLNIYSYWGPRGLLFDPSNSYQVAAVTDTSPYNMGDFRRYNHTAATPTLALGNANLTLTPSATSAPFVVIWSNKYMNFKRADQNGPITRVGLTAFSSLTAAQNYVTSAGAGRVLLNNGGYVYLENISFISTDINLGGTNYAVSPALSGHVVTQTSYPADQYVGTTGSIGVDVSGLAAGASATYYIRTDFYNSNVSNTYDTIRGNLGNSNILTLNVTKQVNPYVRILGVFQPSSTVFANNLTQPTASIGATTITFSFHISTINSTAVTNIVCLRYVGLDGTRYVLTGTYGSATLPANYTSGINNLTSGGTVLTITYTLPAGRTWNYGTNGGTAEYLFEADWDGSNGCF